MVIGADFNGHVGEGSREQRRSWVAMVLRREMLKDTLRLLRVTAVISTNSHREVFYYS